MLMPSDLRLPRRQSSSQRNLIVQLSINYSPQAAGLHHGGAIVLDRWKCSEWPELIAGAQATGLPHYLHFDLQAGPGDSQDIDLDHLAAACAASDTPHVNLHVATRRVDYPEIAVESDAPVNVERVLAQTGQDIRRVGDRFGAEHVIIENLPYRGPDGARLRIGQEASFLHHLCKETGCGFLLDIAHARTAAHHLGYDERIYLASLLVDRLRELHVSDVDCDEQGRLREHMPLSEQDWALLEWCLEQIRQGQWACPWIVAFEYGGIGPLFAWRSESKVLAEQVPRLHRLLGACR